MRTNYLPGGAFQSFYVNRQNLERQLKYPHNNDKKSFEKCPKKMVAAAAFMGATFPVVAINLFKGRGAKALDVFKNSLSTAKDKFKAVYDIFEIENFSQILASTTGAIAMGTISGIFSSKDEENKKAKCKEGVFEFLNNMTPTCFVALGENYSSKTGKFKSPKARAALIATSVIGGMFIANKTSNKINQKIFDKDEDKTHKRSFKPTDCLVHLDDILGLLVIAKIPFAKKIQADKILPFLYAKSGFEAGVAQEE